MTGESRLGSEERAAAALVCVPGMEPAGVRKLVARAGSPRRALKRVQHKVDERAIGELLERRQTRVFLDGGPGYPILDAFPDRPAVLLAEGDAPEVLDRPRVAVVGTRSATLHGRRDAYELGKFLAGAGITVVSGLAIGIDGAAHEGALDAGGGVVGVVATGLDVVYPRRHAVLFERVRRAGLLLSESAFGAQPLRWRFPVRNRIIAGLADAVVVVEATVAGGARITAGFALEYGRTVLAMPGSRRNAAAAGCNALLADGAHPLLDPNDVLVALGLTPGARRGWGAPPARGQPTGDAAAILRACSGEPATADQLVSRTDLSPDAVALAIRELEKGGWIARDQGYLWPR
ncbi:MAG TPA: DNA-processing protein DprA [Acidimicrobiia bacterium]|nr:DNA-processing protein DprA [Acidimicrobiia bacterium]